MLSAGCSRTGPWGSRWSEFSAWGTCEERICGTSPVRFLTLDDGQAEVARALGFGTPDAVV